MGEETALIIVTILITVSLMLIYVRRVRTGARFGLRRLGVPERLRLEVGRAVESGGLLHVTLGRGALNTQNGPVSVAGLQILDHLASYSSRNDVPPVVTMGEGTLFIGGQDSVRYAYEQSGRGDEGRFDTAMFMAPQEFPMTYAAGVSTVLHGMDIANHVAAGRFGSEIALIAEAAARQNINQVIGTDDPTAMAVATATTSDVLWGEELFAAPAYLEGNAAQLASLRTQDTGRWIIAGTILLATLLQLLGIF